MTGEGCILMNRISGESDDLVTVNEVKVSYSEF